MLKKSLLTTCLLVSSFTFVQAQTTMCFKENHASMMTIESVALDGGECGSSKSVKEMKSTGWSVEDIKMTPGTTGTNFVYIFKKGSNNINEEELMNKLYIKLEKEKKAKETKARNEQIQANIEAGKRIYIKSCQSCHGEKGELQTNTATGINALSISDFTTKMKEYKNGANSNIIMSPYGQATTSQDDVNIYFYIKSLNTPKNDEATAK
ncbi:MAG: c-type cytochrome [Candidatus Marinarcus sp.]|uniref:c-type cytochrome n=1 Tax=Candidatus Marinarcus sp. TaxID=3100987 RepID=UPI003AFFED44